MLKFFDNRGGNRGNDSITFRFFGALAFLQLPWFLSCVGIPNFRQINSTQLNGVGAILDYFLPISSSENLGTTV